LGRVTQNGPTDNSGGNATEPVEIRFRRMQILLAKSVGFGSLRDEIYLTSVPKIKELQNSSRESETI